LIGSVPLAIVAGMTEDPGGIQWTPTFVAVLLALSVFGSALVYVIWMSALTEVPLNKANAFSFLVPIFGLTMGVVFYGETLGISKVIGISLAIIGVFLVTRKGSVREAGARLSPSTS